MQESHSNKHPSDFDHEIDLRELFYVLFKGKWIIVSLTGFVSIVGVIYSLLLPNIYESKAMLVPVNSSSAINNALNSYKDFAGLAGISFSSVDEGNSAKAIEKIRSLSFFENNIMPNIYLPDLMAVKSWSAKTNILTYDDGIFDANSNMWVRDNSYPRQQMPSPQESFIIFTTKHLSIIEDKDSGFVSLSIKHQSPFVAKQWAELVVNEINSFFREKDKLESEKAVDYLNQKIFLNNLSEIKEVLAQLLQEETKKLTLIEANQNYVFDYIDPPAVMEKKSEPRRSFIAILGGLLGVMLSVVFVLLRHYVKAEKFL